MVYLFLATVPLSRVPPPVVLVMPIEEAILIIIPSPQLAIDRTVEQETWLCKNKKDIRH